MNCATCKCDAECDSTEIVNGETGRIMFVTVLANGKQCIDCEAFTCTACLNTADAIAFPGPFDQDLCVSCNHQHDIRDAA